MKGFSLVVLLMLFYVSFANSYSAGGEYDPGNDPSMRHRYDRIDEVKRECNFIMSSALELKPDDNRIYIIKNELSFLFGDWRQETGNAPLMPFVDPNPNNSSDIQSPLSLASFWVLDVDRGHRSKKYVSVNGFTNLVMAIDGSFDGRSFDRGSRFEMWPGHSKLSVAFQGIYTESATNVGERILCLLGTTMLPARQVDSTDPWEWAKGSSANYNQPPLLQDDRVLLVLHYPKTMSLTSRGIKGEMRSLNKKSNPKYFDEIHIISQLGASVNYEFGSEEIVLRACDPYPYQDSLISSDMDIYKGAEFCTILQQFTNNEVLDIVPNWRCDGTDDYCSKLGPFMTDAEIKATDGGFKGVRLLIQDVRCEHTPMQENVYFAKVSAVFRVLPPFENRYISFRRSGLSNLTLPAEGIWNSTSGQLCMVGCLGLVNSRGNGCKSRICMYMPLTFSVKQRSVIIGSISSIARNSYFPLSFEKVLQPTELSHWFSASHLSYRYSKIASAGTVLEKNEPFNFGTLIKTSLLEFPKLKDSDTLQGSLYLLAEDLTLHVAAVPDPYPNVLPPRTDVQLEILSVGPLFGPYLLKGESTSGDGTPYDAKAEYTEKQLLLNVSAQLTLSGKSYSNFSVLFLEGLYDPHAGQMYLIGCRDARASWAILFESRDLENGLDCFVEVVVSYPPTTVRWLVNPTAKISISSQRTEDDPLHFSTVKLQTLPILYRRQREDILSRRDIEGILRILTLTLALICILTQLFYIRGDAESVPFISLVMLGVQAIGYGIPLVTDAEALFKKMSLESYQTQSYDLQRNHWLQLMDYSVKLLVLLCFLVTLRLLQKVWKSRIRLLTRAPLEPHRVPNDKWVLLSTLVIHCIGFLVILVIHMVSNSKKPLQTKTYLDPSGNYHTLREWETELEEYLGLVQDFFLLPQIIGNILWQIHCKPLRKSYFIGITVVRLLPHVYDYLRPPVFNPYFAEEYEFVNPKLDFYSKFGDITIPLIAVTLAVVAYIQQKWNYEELSQTLVLGKHKLLPVGSKVYERLPSLPEAELVSGVNEDVSHHKGHDNQD